MRIRRESCCLLPLSTLFFLKCVQSISDWEGSTRLPPLDDTNDIVSIAQDATQFRRGCISGRASAWGLPAAPDHERLSLSESNDGYVPSFRSTGTTIAGLVWKDFVLLAADTRATAGGSLVADPSCIKIHSLGRNVVAAGAGTSADVEHITRLSSTSNAWWNAQHGYEWDTDSFTAFLQSHLLSGEYEATLIVGGLDRHGNPQLRAVHPHGSIDALSFSALGSGGMAAMAVLEKGVSSLSSEASLDDAKRLIVDAIRAGIKNDLGSGSKVNLVAVSASTGVQQFRDILAEEILPSTRDVEATPDAVAILKKRAVLMTEKPSAIPWQDW